MLRKDALVHLKAAGLESAPASVPPSNDQPALPIYFSAEQQWLNYAIGLWDRLIDAYPDYFPDDREDAVLLVAALALAAEAAESTDEEAEPSQEPLTQDEVRTVAQLCSLLEQIPAFTMPPAPEGIPFDTNLGLGVDIGFLRAGHGKLIEMIKENLPFLRLQMGAHPFQESKQESPAKHPGTLRMVILADAGTGMYGYPKACDFLRAEHKRKPIDWLVHLGDVYYTGEPKEFDKHLLKNWPTELAPTRHLLLNGNHEMYSGGRGYFEAIKKEPFKQDASYFALQTSDFLILALDTAHRPHALQDPQLEFIHKMVAQAETRPLILLSHHPLFSRFEQKKNNQLQKQLQQLLDSRRIRFWYWGHEHSCVSYDAHPQWQVRGRCVGHAAVPERRDQFAKEKDISWCLVPDRSYGSPWYEFGPHKQVPAGRILWENDMVVEPSSPQKYMPQGFLILDIKGKTLIETYCASDGRVLRVEEH